MKTTVKTNMIFGYGSLINESSLRATAPAATNIRAACVKGFRRNFDKWATSGLTAAPAPLARAPYCALNITATENPRARVNGVVFEVSDEALQALLVRERSYDMITTAVYDYETNAPLGDCLVFASPLHTGRYDFGSPAQALYLQTCLLGARRFGEVFYREFWMTTYINNQKLRDVPALHYVGRSARNRKAPALSITG